MALMDINWHPDDRHLRRFGWYCTGVALLAVVIALTRGAVRGEHVRAVLESWRALAFLSFGLASALLAQLRPRSLKPLYLGMTVLGWPIGWCISLIVLALIFFALLTPLAIVFRLRGRDALQRRFDPRARSYWIRRRPAGTPASYLRES